MKKITFYIAAVLLITSMLVILLCSCTDKNDTEDSEMTNNVTEEVTEEVKKEDIVIFADGEYKCAFVYPVLTENEVSEIRNKFRASFKNKTGITAPFKTDDNTSPDENVVEVLLGNTNRPESAAPAGTGNTDAYYVVAVIGNKVVINGSDPYQLSLAVEYFTEKYLSGDKADTLVISAELNEQKVIKDHTRDYWSLYSIPAYPLGSNKLVQNIYNCGTTIKDFSNGGVNSTSSKLHLITHTTADEFSAYMEKLEANGYEKEFENNLENNLYATYYNGEQRVHISFNPVFENQPAEARVILDPTGGMSLKDFGYSYTPKAGEQSVFYQYAIPMTNGANNNKPNCGSLDIVKCADNSVIIIDGGDKEGTGYVQMTDEALAGLDAFLREITGTQEGEKVRISAWYMTHYHNDHTYGFYTFLEKYGDGYTLERIVANLPESEIANWNTQWWYRIIGMWNTLIKVKYPECKEIKVHAGQKIQIADVTLQVLYTHEDLLTTTKATFNSTDSNDTSTVIRMDNGDLSMLVIGDANTRTSARLRRCFTTTTLKSDIMHSGHHMLYHLPLLYTAVDPEIFYLSTSKELKTSESTLEGTTYKYRYEYIANLVGESNCYFAGNETVGFSSIKDGLVPDYYKEGVVGR